MFQEEFLLTNETAKRLFHQYAEHMPIIDYHCHLLPKEIYENKVFEDLGDIWLSRDHYKWRAMRTFGINEKYITGNETTFHEKYLAFAEIYPQLIGNPIYIWCALELKRLFGIDEPLSKENAESIYEKTTALIQEKQMTPRYLMKQFKVEFICTTDDPTDDLNYHIAMEKDKTFETKVVPAFRPDMSFYLEKPAFPAYIQKLSNLTGIQINTLGDVMSALDQRFAFFKAHGAIVTDLAIEDFTYAEANEAELTAALSKAKAGQTLTSHEINAYRSVFTVEFGKLCYKYGTVMQLHIGTYKGANHYFDERVGESTGFDCVDDSTDIKSVGSVLNALTNAQKMPKMILYPLNINNYESFAILAAGFCSGEVKAQVQLGTPWWFNDQVYGINKQFESVANLYPIALSVGMLTDSRSFLSYSRYEVYRRVLCNYFGGLVERGEYFSDEKNLREIIENISYRNAKEYFHVE